MKICHAVYSLEMGGAEVLVAQLCRQQRAEGHDVSVCAYSKLGSIGEALRSEGFEIVVPGEGHPLKTMWRYLHYFRRIKPDVVHCHNPAPTLQAAFPARLAGTRCILSTRHSLVAPPYDMKEEKKYNLMARSCDWIVGVCETTCENLRGIPSAQVNKIVRVYNGSAPVVGIVDNLPQAAELRLLFVGRLAEIKDLPTLLRAVAIARKRIPGLRLSIVGDGPARKTLEQSTNDLAIDDCVTFWGQHLDTARFFSEADVFAMSSISEGLPMSMLQAMSSGIPMVATDVGGMAEVVRMSEGGLLSPVKDPAAMARSIERFALSLDLRKQCSANARLCYQQNFTLEAMSRGYMELYRA